ncbi:MAG: hypothetical protein K2K02_05580 [Ruminococcus sp.]|nr:hypothetical protein [Ruminococcus sp.]
MKKSVLIMINALLVVAILVLFIIQSSAKTDISKGFDGNYMKSGFIDNTGLAENPEEMTKLVRETAEKLEMNIFVYVAGEDDIYRSDYDIECFADDSYDEIFGEDTDGVFYYMDLSGRVPAYDYISASGKAVLLYQNCIDNIFTRLDNYLPASGQTIYPENIEDAVKEFLRAIKDYGKTAPGSNSMTYYYDESSGKYMFMKNGKFVVSNHKPIAYNVILMLVCVVVGLIVAVIVYFATKQRYIFKKSQNSGIYVRNEKTVFHRSTDTFIRSYTTEHKIETSSSSSSRSSGGGGGHSHSGGHGGGGHHR